MLELLVLLRKVCRISVGHLHLPAIDLHGTSINAILTRCCVNHLRLYWTRRVTFVILVEQRLQSLWPSRRLAAHVKAKSVMLALIASGLHRGNSVRMMTLVAHCILDTVTHQM